MIYRVFVDKYSDTKLLGEFGTLSAAKEFIKSFLPGTENFYCPFYDTYYQRWDLSSEPEYWATSVECYGNHYSILPAEDKPCLECGQD